MTMSVSSRVNSELPDILPADEACASRPYNFEPRGATTVSSACRLVSRLSGEAIPRLSAWSSRSNRPFE